MYQQTSPIKPAAAPKASTIKPTPAPEDPTAARVTDNKQKESREKSPPAASQRMRSKVKQPSNNVKKCSTAYQRKPRVLLLGDSIAHNANFRAVEEFTHTTIKTSKAYGSVWDKDARFKHLNATDVAKNELGKAHFDHLVLASPTVDITNMDTSNVKPEDSTKVFKQKVESSCQNMLKVAESALANHSGLEKVTIMNHGPRYDTQKVDPVSIKQQLASYANRFLLELWLDSPHKNRIFIGSHTLECSPNIQKDRYTDESSGRYDGVHLYGPNGKYAYTASVINILQ